MAELTLGPWKVGIDQVSGETNLPHGAVQDAVDVDFDRAGCIVSRQGYTRLLTESGLHSLWTGVAGSFAVRDSALSRVHCDGATLTTAPIVTLPVDLPVSFADLNEGVVAATWREVFFIVNDVATHLGVENPGGIGVAAETYGGLDAGRYAVAVSFLRGDEESGLSYGAFATVASGGGLRFTLPQPLEGEADGLRLYRTQANGDVYHHVTDLPLGITSYLLGATPVGRQAETQFQERLLGGQIVRYWRGHVLIARNNLLLFSRPLRYGLYDPRHDFAQFATRITLLEPVDGGVFVGTADGVVFLAGESPATWNLHRTGGKPPFEGSSLSIDAAELAPEAGPRGERIAIWLARNGFVIGTAQGGLIESQSNRIRLPLDQAVGAATLVRARRVTALVQ